MMQAVQAVNVLTIARLTVEAVIATCLLIGRGVSSFMGVCSILSEGRPLMQLWWLQWVLLILLVHAVRGS